MGGIFGGGGSNKVQVTRYTQLNMQTSAQGVCIPIGWGKFRASTNIIWYNNFKAKPVKQKAGKGGGHQVTSYTYSVACILALCEGPVAGIGSVWASRATTTLAALNLTLYTGATPQSPAAWIVSNFPAQAQSYAGTAYVFSSLYDLGSSPDLPAHNFEVIGALSGTMPYGTYGVDANPADIIQDYLTNTQYSLDFPSSAIDATSLAFYKTYCQAQGLFLSPYLVSQEQVVSTLQRWGQLTNTWIFWSGGVVKFVPLGDSTIAANGTTYTPTTTAVYDLGPDDFLVGQAGDSPVTVTRIDPLDGYNNVQIDINDRGNAYASTPIVWSDQASEDQYGQLQSMTISASEVCDPAIGQVMAALIGLRVVYIRNKDYRFTLPTTFVLLEPGDIVTLTEPHIGLSLFGVRIKEVEENDRQELEVIAEEFPAGAGTGAGIGTPPYFANPPQPNGAATPPNVLAAPGAVNTPVIFEPSPVLTGGVPQVWIGLSGGADWGGADVYISFDGTTYSFVGTQQGGAVQGVTTATLASGSDPDTIHTLAIDLAASGSVLPSTASHADADAGRTLCLVDNEAIAYGAVAPGATSSKFNLTYLRRGQYGTTIASHGAGAAFTRFDPATTFVYQLPIAYVGQTIYLKFCSFNSFGQAKQDISAATQYTFTPAGVGYTIAAPTSPSLAASSATQPDGTTLLTMTLSWTASTGPLVGSYEVQWSADGGATWTVDISAGATATVATLSPAAPSTSYKARVRAVSQSGLAISSWATSGTVSSGTVAGAGVTTYFAAGLTAAGTSQGTALVLAALVNQVTTTAAGTGVKLPVVSTSTEVEVWNDGANALLVYPPTSGNISGAGTNVGVTVPPSSRATFLLTAANTWSAG